MAESTTPLTKEQRRQLQALEAGATPGPWVTDHATVCVEKFHWSDPSRLEKVSLLDGTDGGYGGWFLEQADADYAVAARNALPALLEQIETVLFLHRPVRLGSVRVCATCSGQTYPCRTAAVFGVAATKGKKP